MFVRILVEGNLVWLKGMNYSIVMNNRIINRKLRGNMHSELRVVVIAVCGLNGASPIPSRLYQASILYSREQIEHEKSMGIRLGHQRR